MAKNPRLEYQKTVKWQKMSNIGEPASVRELLNIPKTIKHQSEIVSKAFILDN